MLTAMYIQGTIYADDGTPIDAEKYDEEAVITAKVLNTEDDRFASISK